jgi:hypothetical protein
MHDRPSPQTTARHSSTGILRRHGGWTMIGVSLLVLGFGPLFPGASPAQTPAISPPVPQRSLLDAGHEAFGRGAFEQAAEIWTQAVQEAHDAGQAVENMRRVWHSRAPCCRWDSMPAPRSTSIWPWPFPERSKTDPARPRQWNGSATLIWREDSLMRRLKPCRAPGNWRTRPAIRLA